MNTLVSPDNTFAVWAFLFGAAAFGFYAETTRIGKKLSGALLTMAFAFAFSNLGVIPASGAPAYDAVWSYLVPVAVPLLLLKADVRKIIKEAGPTLIAFIIGAIGTILGTIAAFYAVPLGPEGWKLAGIFSATYVGGSVNYVAVANVLDLRSGDLLSAGVAADNLVMALYFLLLFSLPSIGFLQRFFVKRHHTSTDENNEPIEAPAEAQQLPGLLKTAGILAFGTAVCAIGYGVADLISFRNGGILVVTAITVFAATLVPRWMDKLKGAQIVGNFLMQVFFAVIGASANIAMVVKIGPWLFAFAGLILAVHLVFLLVAGSLLKLSLAELVIASNANMGGPTTAAAMASARRWDKLVLPSILCGTFGYAIATFIGAGLGNWLR